MAVVYTHNIRIDGGSDYEQEYDMLQMGGDPVDLTNYSAQLQLRKHAGSKTAVSFTISFLDRVTGKIKLSIPSFTTTKLKAGRYVYDIIFTKPGGKKEIVLQGRATVVEGISTNCDSFANAGNMTRVCIAVIDESDSQTTSIMESQWTQFRSQFPYRKFYLLTPTATNAFGTPSESNDFDRLRCPDNFLTETTINTPPLI